MWIFTHLEDTLLDILVSFLAGFAAYLAAEHSMSPASWRRWPAGWCWAGSSTRPSRPARGWN